MDDEKRTAVEEQNFEILQGELQPESGNSREVDEDINDNDNEEKATPDLQSGTLYIYLIFLDLKKKV